MDLPLSGFGLRPYNLRAPRNRPAASPCRGWDRPLPVARPDRTPSSTRPSGIQAWPGQSVAQRGCLPQYAEWSQSQQLRQWCRFFPLPSARHSTLSPAVRCRLHGAQPIDEKHVDRDDPRRLPGDPGDGLLELYMPFQVIGNQRFFEPTQPVRP